MKINISWLKELLNIKISDNKLIKQLIMLGIEVEQIHSLYKVSYIKQKFIVGKIINYNTLDYVKFCYKINFGNNIVKTIYSSQNIINLIKKKVIVILPNNLIILSKDKLYLTDFNQNNAKHTLCKFLFYNYFHLTEGKHQLFSILEISENIPLGMVINKQLNLNDKCIKLNIAFNRLDLKNLIGICREITALNNKVYDISYDIPYTSYVNKTNLKNKYTHVFINIKTDITDFFYVGRMIQNVSYNLNQIPLWMYNRLLISECLSTNPLVNIINYVFIETGIIINIYDVDLIEKELIITTTKNLYKNTITNKTLVFTTNKKEQILSIAGKGYFNNHFIKNNSNNLYIESISLTNKFYNDDNNYYNFIYDSNIQLYAINRVTQLIKKFISNCSIGPINILGKQTYFLSYKINVYTKQIKTIIGQTIRLNKIKNILNNLKFKLNIINFYYWVIIPPVWRRDICQIQDIIEEIVKFYGYQNIKVKQTLSTKYINNINTNDKYLFIDKIKSFLIHKGYQEIITYSLVDIKLQKLLFAQNNQSITIINPISKELSCLRNNLLNGLLNNIIYNQNYQFNRIKIFEIGYCYDKVNDKIENQNYYDFTLNNNLFIKQTYILSGAIYGNKYDRKWCFKSKLPDFFDIKGEIENILEILLINPDMVYIYKPKLPENIFNNHYFGYIYINDIIIGKMGLINQNILNILKIKTQVIYFELHLEKIFLLLFNKPQVNIFSVSYLPVYERDISVIVDNDLPSSKLIQECKNILQNYLLNISIFDIYRDNIMKINNKKSIGINLILQDVHHTLNNQQINKIISKCINGLSNKFKIMIRKP